MEMRKLRMVLIFGFGVVLVAALLLLCTLFLYSGKVESKEMAGLLGAAIGALTIIVGGFSNTVFEVLLHPGPPDEVKKEKSSTPE
jgi:uncharacterized SAM-binding protein YcdF (DUF218 family)